MNLNIKKIAILLILVLVLLSITGCNEKPENKPQQTNSTISAEIKIEEEKADDSKDPENIENTKSEDGVKVDFAKVEVKKGVQSGIDVSKWQGKIDWQKVKKAGIDFAIIRIGYRAENGKLYRDSNADYNIQQAQKAGVLVGVYFFSTATTRTEAMEEANWTISAIKGYKISYPVVYDCEGFKNSDSRMYSLTAEQRTQNALSFLDTIKKSGYESMFYGSKSDLADPTAFNIAKIEKSYKIWVAQYKNPPYPQSQKPDYNGRYDMWQYTDKGIVSGVEGNCDMIVSYFEKEIQKPKDEDAEVIIAKPPKTQTELIYTDTNEDVTAKEKVNLRSGAGTNFDIVSVLKNGDIIKRTGVGSNGWSRLDYKGKTVYAITSYLTTDLNFKPPVDDGIKTEFETVNEQVTAKSETNLRTLPSVTDSEVVYTLKNGEYLTRTGISSNGWSRLEYNGQTVYAVSSYLTTDLLHKQPTDNVITSDFRSVHQKVTAKSETNLRTHPSTTNSKVVYTLKNGEYLTRTGISSNGWSRLEYNGQIVYAVSNYLTD